MNVARSLMALVLIGAAASADAQQREAEPANPFAQAKFVPDLSLILDLSYLHRDISNEEMASLFVPGFTHAHLSTQEGHHHGFGERGFNLNYAELVLASVVDPYFDLLAVFHLAEDAFEIEEAFLTTRRLPWGLQVKGGKFLSHFGRINQQHAHYWDFSCAPLVYTVFFGPEMLDELGARLTWVPPLDWYVMIGGEVLQGTNPVSFGYDGISTPDGVVVVQGSEHPNLAVAYAKSSIDLGNLTALAGLSVARGHARINHGLDGSEAGEAISGRTTILGVDLTFRYLLSSFQYVGLQAEYLHREIAGDSFEKNVSGSVTESTLDKRQAGLYAQLTARFSKRWRAGVRYDLLPQNEVVVGGVSADVPSDLDGIRTMVEYNPTEFSRLRLEYGYDHSFYENYETGPSRRPVHEVLLAVNIAIGAHGAHSF